MRSKVQLALEISRAQTALEHSGTSVKMTTECPSCVPELLDWLTVNSVMRYTFCFNGGRPISERTVVCFTGALMFCRDTWMLQLPPCLARRLCVRTCFYDILIISVSIFPST